MLCFQQAFTGTTQSELALAIEKFFYLVQTPEKNLTCKVVEEITYKNIIEQ